MQEIPDEEIRLTQFSHGAGCGCKIAPDVLDLILQTTAESAFFPQLLVGNHTRDDAAVYALDEHTALISTTDFFTPIVDNAYDFGRIASVNAISDVYAMGGRPILAIAILGWPVNKLSTKHAAQVLQGARSVCAAAGVPLAGGHSIDTPEPIFGLAVNGLAPRAQIKTNTAARAGDLLYLTKPLGVGIITTAEKRGVVQDAHRQAALVAMTTLNKIGETFGALPYVHALTDVTGFGLLGHLLEMCKASNVNAEIIFGNLPLFDGLADYIAAGAIPGGAHRNWKAYGADVAPLSDNARLILTDPQTSGPLLVAVAPENKTAFEALLTQNGLAAFAHPIGNLLPRQLETPLIRVLE